ncbi:MAG TPA: metal-dependent hydrolase [Pilimelia sp.]|nr:metal-dependent hydrolase [Pilimelia sp.]
MMGRSHALSGAASWLAGSWALDAFAGYEQSALAVAVGTAVCAGGALLPDLDLSGRVTANKGGATVARTFGVFSLFVAEVVEKLSLVVYHATRLSKDPDRQNGHRTLTHTVPFTVFIGWVTTAACARFGTAAVVGVLFVTFGLALRGLFEDWAQRVGWAVVTLVSAAAAYGTFLALPGGRGYPLLGLAVGVGCFVHLLGDIITSAGVPILWPIAMGRRRWRMIGVPDAIALRVGGTVEVYVLRGAFVAVSVLAVGALVGPPLLDRLTPYR